MIRVALSTSVAQRGRSGVASYLFGLLEGLASIDAPVKIILVGLDADRPLFARWLDRCEWSGVAERWRPALRNVIWHQTAFRRRLRELRADVVHIPSYRRILWRAPCPQVVTIHDCAAFAVAGKYDFARMFYGRQVVTRLARTADTIMTVSAATADDVARHFGLAREAIQVVWNGLDHTHFRPPEPARLARFLDHQVRQRAPYFLYLARLEHPAKNHVRLIAAFEQFAAAHPDHPHELLLGGADWHGAGHIHARLAASPLRGRIRALGFVDQADLPLWYAGATAMVYPSLFEGFGLPPAEAMACGCPVICSTRGSLGEVVGDAARLIDPEDIPALAAALGELADPAARARWHNRGLARATLFDWNETARKVTTLYQGAVAQRPSA
jgi:glycosyltransferase involved in cell wall biosynthesis